MSEQIKYLRWASTVFKILSFVLPLLSFVALILSIIQGVLLAVYSPGGSVFISVTGIIFGIVAIVLSFFILWTVAIVLAFLANLGERQENLQWGVQDLRRKLIAVRGEEETRG